LRELDWQKNACDILRLIKEAIIFTDREKKILFMNRHAEEIFGWPAEEMVGSSFSRFFLPDDVEILLPNIFAQTEQEGEFGGEVLLGDSRGRRLFCWLSGSIYQAEQSELFIFGIHDISEYKRLERECLEADRFARMGKIFDELAHHVRNPVVAIGGFARLLGKAKLDSSKSKWYLETLEKETARLERIISRIMEFSRVVEPQYAWERIATIMHGWEAKAQERFGDGRLSFRPLADEACETGLLTDRDLLIKSLMRILENAMEAIVNESDRVIVSAAVKKGALRFTVADSGTGIPIAEQLHIFDPFYTTKPARVGLGLTIAASVISELGGKIRMKSKPGVGSTFVVSCPLERRRAIRVRRL